ncbi:MAG: hypothetical protein P8015_06945 [Acidihalobacter sp.]|jgi:short subunit dehydrogenase-like uncharacterized protein
MKHLSVLRRFGRKVVAPVSGLVPFAWAGLASAQTTGTDYSSLTGAVDFTTAITAILAVFAALAGVYVVMKAGSLILSKIRR